MTPDAIRQELEAFEAEYGSFLRSVSSSVANGTAAGQATATGSVTFTTAEEETYDCEVSDAGWQVPGSSTFSTSQEMLSALSPQFRADWAMQLLKRIESLAADNLDDEDERDRTVDQEISAKDVKIDAKEERKPVFKERLL